VTALSYQMNRRIVIEEKTITDSGDGYGGEVTAWAEFASVWAEIQDVLPSKSEKQSDVIRTATRPARIRIRYLPGITSDMRITTDNGTRIMQIIAGPAEIGHRRVIELMAEEYSTGGA
jgi:SPP1 family predicted phage head-tail adaptor